MIDPIEKMVENSYKDFHCKGLDYICLRRTHKRTTKLYLFEGDVSKAPEVVNPHDHRYDFVTQVLAGSVINHVFEPTALAQKGSVFQRFHYYTPLNGGTGFSWDGVERLDHVSKSQYERGESYYSFSSSIHTIQITSPQTALLLIQYEDILPIGYPTKTYTRGNKAPPSTSGLYSKFKPDEILARLKKFPKLLEKLSQNGV